MLVLAVALLVPGTVLAAGEPAAPTRLTATAMDDYISLTWNDNADDETGFLLQRKAEDGSFRTLAELEADTEEYDDEDVDAGVTYTYRVRAFNDEGYSDWSNTDSARLSGGVPEAPEDLEAEVLSPSSVELTWTDNSDNEEGFSIERRASGGSWREIDTVDEDEESYTVTGLEPGTLYYFRVRAYNEDGESDYSNVVSVTTADVPSAPEDLEATALSSSQVRLTWRDTSDNEEGFKIERKRAGGSWSQVARVGEDEESYTATGLEADTLYYFRVRAYNEDGDSEYSNEDSVRTCAVVRRVVRLQVGSTSYSVDGQARVMDAAPVIVQGRTLLPVRFAAEGIGAVVGWDNAARKVTITLEGTTVELWIDSNVARVNGSYRFVDPENGAVKPVIMSPGRTMVPLRFVAESLGSQVDWNAQTRQITVTYPAS